MDSSVLNALDDLVDLPDRAHRTGKYSIAVEYAGTTAQRIKNALLTAEPEPCEGHDGINNCQHCGGRAEIVHGMQDGWIACSKCGAAGPRRSSDEDAIAAWNRSYATQVADKRAEKLRALREALEPFADADCEDERYSEEDNPQLLSCEEYGKPRAKWCAVCNAKAVLAATEPKP